MRVNEVPARPSRALECTLALIHRRLPNGERVSKRVIVLFPAMRSPRCQIIFVTKLINSINYN